MIDRRNRRRAYWIRDTRKSKVESIGEWIMVAAAIGLTLVFFGEVVFVPTQDAALSRLNTSQ
jgi:hypothetical protein